MSRLADHNGDGDCAVPTTGLAAPVQAACSEEDAVAAARTISAGVAAKNAATADRDAVFPVETIGALAESRLLAALVPVAAGGLGLSVSALSRIAVELSRGCGSSAMIWVMHQLQLACVVRHGGSASSAMTELISAVVERDELLASVTSEKGIGGDISRSRTCVERSGEGCLVVKDSPTVSYGEQAGAFLITARRGPAAAEDDQVAVVVRADQVELDRTSRWNPMGMRGTCSPGFRVRAQFDAGQILPDPFGVVAARTLTPLSEILWSSVWIGLASEALGRAARSVRARAGGTSVVDLRMGWADQILHGLEAQLNDAVAWFEAADRGELSAGPESRARLHALKVAASTSTVDIALQALAMCGFAGYQEDGQYSIARLLRDLHSAQIMVSNDRLLEAIAANAVVARAGGDTGGARLEGRAS